MKIKNMAAQAVHGLENLMASCLKRNRELDANGVGLVSEIIKSAQHFALPDGGRIFDDDLRGIKNTNIRLPYGAITAEYLVTNQTGNGVSCTRRVAYAIELTRDKLSEISKNLHGHFDGMLGFHKDDVFIFIGGVYMIDETKQWLPSAIGVVLASGWDYGSKKLTGEKGEILTTQYFPVMGDYIAENVVSESCIHELYGDVMDEASSILDMCEALSCSNVKTEKQKYNPLKDRPMSEPKVPVYETKVLTIDTGAVKKTGTGSGGGDGGGNGRSVRQHLRRGHIRRLKSGNLWVQSCVVGSDKNGIITKSYRVK